MRRVWILLALCILAGSAAAAQDQDFSKVQIKVTKVAGTVYMLEGRVETLAPPLARTAL